MDAPITQRDAIIDDATRRKERQVVLSGFGRRGQLCAVELAEDLNLTGARLKTFFKLALGFLFGKQKGG